LENRNQASRRRRHVYVHACMYICMYVDRQPVKRITEADKMLMNRQSK
jgi:hypothetical protein